MAIKNYYSNTAALDAVLSEPVWEYGNYPTHALFNVNIEAAAWKGKIPLNPYRKTAWKTAIREFVGYLRGYTTLEEFHSLNCKTWDANGANPTWLNNPNYKGEGDLGRIYGAQARDWKKPDGSSVDQLKAVIGSLIKHKDHRGNYMTFWNPGEFDQMCLRPCMHSHQFFINENGALCLTSYSRSMDGPLGGDANVVQSWFFLYFMCAVTGLPFGEANIMVTNYHIYTNQVDTASEMLSRRPADECIVRWVGPELTLELLMTEDVTKYFIVYGMQSEETSKYEFTTTNAVSDLGHSWNKLYTK